MTTKPTYGNWNTIDILNEIDKYILFTMKEPWEIIKPKLNITPSQIIFNKSMDIDHLEELYQQVKNKINGSYTIIGIGGGTACDTAKYLSWVLKEKDKFNLDLILIPSIISVDAFLCSSIAVRYESKVRYIGESDPNKILIDYDLIKRAPKYLNRAGVSDTISITSALGDWKLAHEENNDPFDKSVYNEAKSIAEDLIQNRNDIREVNEDGIKALVEGFYNEVILCEKWGNARPEEGSEHFLAYCIESITQDHYIHGKIIGMNILISLYLQEDFAEFPKEYILQFFKDIKLDISPQSLNISSKILKKALKKIQSYVKKENLMYSIYNSPRIDLNKKKIKEIIQFISKI